MRVLEQWDVWQVRWRHEDDGTEKPRPAVILSKSGPYADGSPIHVVKVSASPPIRAERVCLLETDVGFNVTGLTKSCFIHVEPIRRITTDDLLNGARRGYLPEYIARDLLRKILEAGRADDDEA